MMTAKDGPKPKSKILGYETAVLEALWQNILSWFVRTFAPSLLPKLLPKCDQEEDTHDNRTTTRESKSSTTTTTNPANTRCISIGRPGGIEQLRLVTLKPGIMTCGYNLMDQDIPFTKPMSILLDDNNNNNNINIDIPSDCVVLDNQAFSVNYADCCIRWGLYESAKRHVGYPIVPGFDVAGIVERVPPPPPPDNTTTGGGSNNSGNNNSSNINKEEEFQIGDAVFGCSLFGAYSSRVLVPKMQLRKIPPGLSMAQAAALPTVSLTALYALFLAGHFPITKCKFTNRAVLIHSAAGGVGSMLVQMSKLLGLSPIVGVVGRTSKVDAAKALGCDVVIDKSQQQQQQSLWSVARAVSPTGYASILDLRHYPIRTSTWP